MNHKLHHHVLVFVDAFMHCPTLYSIVLYVLCYLATGFLSTPPFNIPSLLDSPLLFKYLFLYFILVFIYGAGIWDVYFGKALV